VSFLLRYAVSTLALYVAAWAIDGISYGDQWWTLLIAGLVFTVVNMVVKPIVTVLSIPFIIVTLGIALFFVNLAMLALTALLVKGFTIDGFWSAVEGTILVWAVNVVADAFGRSQRRRERERDAERVY
jgi:putative membrane protein